MSGVELYLGVSSAHLCPASAQTWDSHVSRPLGRTVSSSSSRLRPPTTPGSQWSGQAEDLTLKHRRKRGFQGLQETPQTRTSQLGPSMPDSASPNLEPLKGAGDKVPLKWAHQWLRCAPHLPCTKRPSSYQTHCLISLPDNPCFSHKRTRAQRREITHPGLQSWEGVGRELDERK